MDYVTNHYLTTPFLSWDAMLNMTKVEFDLIPYPNISIFFEKSTRGGVSSFIDILKPIIDTSNLMRRNKNQNILCI